MQPEAASVLPPGQSPESYQVRSSMHWTPTVEAPIVTVELHITPADDLSEVFMVEKSYHGVRFDLLCHEHAEFLTQAAPTQTAHAYYNLCYTCRLCVLPRLTTFNCN